MPVSYTAPETCDYYQICLTNDTRVSDTALTILKQEGPFNVSHQTKTNYSMFVAGVNIPLLKTVRNFSSSAKRVYGDAHVEKYYINENYIAPVECTERAATVSSFRVKEDCVIEKSVLCYLDQSYGVCLYRYQKDEIHLEVTSDETAYIKESWGTHPYFQAQVKTDNYTATRTVEWRLIAGGAEEVLKSTVTELEPFGPRNSGLPSGTGLFPDYAPDPDTRLVLLFPTPGSMGIPWSDVLCRLGCYEFGYDTPEGAESQQNMLDGGNKDHFYPEWCRNLQQDPFWRKAADNRYMVSWFQFALTNDYSYVPPEVTTDPLPRGSYAKHPQVGEAYQFLVDGDTVKTSPDFNALIDEALPDGEETHDTTLYYPIGVI